MTAIALGAGAIIGSLWIYMGGSWTYESGTLGAVLAYLFAGILCSLLGLVYAELTSAMPKAGGAVGWTLKALGPNWSFLSFITTLPLYILLSAIYPALLVFLLKLTGVLPQEGIIYIWSIGGIAVYLSDVVIGMVAMLIFVAISSLEVKLAGWFQAVTFGILVAIGAWAFASGVLLGNVENAKPLFTGAGGIIWTMLMAPGFMAGFDVIPQISEELRIPHKKIGVVVLGSVWAAAIFYIIVSLGSGFSADVTVRSQDYTGLVAGLPALYHSDVALYLLVIGALMGLVTTWNAFMSGAARLIYGAARGGLLPSYFVHLNRHSVPDRPLYLLTLIALVSSFFGVGLFMLLIRGSSLFLVICWLITALVFIQFRRKEPSLERPFKVPFGLAVGIAAAIISLVWLIMYFPPVPGSLEWPLEWLFPIGFAIVAIALWLWQRTSNKDKPLDERIKAMLGEYAGKKEVAVTVDKSVPAQNEPVQD